MKAHQITRYDNKTRVYVTMVDGLTCYVDIDQNMDQIGGTFYPDCEIGQEVLKTAIKAIIN